MFERHAEKLTRALRQTKYHQQKTDNGTEGEHDGLQRIRPNNSDNPPYCCVSHHR